jgi:hypothetical protein
MERPLAAELARLADDALTCCFVADPWPADQLEAYSALLVPARLNTYRILAAIARQFTELDRTADREPTPAQMDAFDKTLAEASGRERRSRMRVALERAEAMMNRALLAAAKIADPDEATFFRSCCRESGASIRSAMAYLTDLEDNR